MCLSVHPPRIKGSDEAASAQPSDAASDSLASRDNRAGTRRTVEGRRVGLIVTAVGLVCTASGLYGVGDSALFGIRGERVNATVVEVVPNGEGGYNILEFAVAARLYRTDARCAFGLVWGHPHRVGSLIPVLYMPDHPEGARLAGFKARFFIPLFLLGLGLVFTAAGVLVLRHGLLAA